MAMSARSEQEGCRDYFYIWVRTHIKSNYNFILPVLAETLSGLISKHNSTIKQLAVFKEATAILPIQPAIYEVVFGAPSGKAADTILAEVQAKMTEMEERMQKLRFLHEPEGWFVDETLEREDAHDTGKDD